MRRQATAPSRVLVVISTIVVALLLLLASGAFAGSALGADRAARSAIEVDVTRTYTVRAGDSLWTIAQTTASELGTSGADLRATVDAIRSLNGLETSVITPGDVLVLPGS